MRIYQILLLSILYYSSTVAAQQKKDFQLLEDGKEWIIWHYNGSDAQGLEKSQEYSFSYIISGDTLIGDTRCMKLYSLNEQNTGNTTYKMALHESDGKVYFIPEGAEQCYLLYDFSPAIGSTVTVSDVLHPGEWYHTLRIVEERVLLIAGQEKRAIQVSIDNGAEDFRNESGWWIEGVGSELGLLNTWGFRMPGSNNYLEECRIGGKPIFKREEFIPMVSGIDCISISDGILAKHGSSARYDLQGRRIQGTPGKGVYIRDGRKYVAE